MIKLFLIRINNPQKFSKHLTKWLISEYLNISQKFVVFDYANLGKPYLKLFPKIHFNVSHTKDLFLLGISTKPIGVDVETLRKYNYKLTEYLFTENEKKYILSDYEKIDYNFTKAWTMKEAFLKNIGTGIDKNANSLDVITQSDFIFLRYDEFFISVSFLKKTLDF